MTFARKRYGAAGEARARRFLESRRMRFVAANVSTPFGEIDLVMQDRRCRVFVEVKARTSQSAGAPQEAVTGPKLSHIIRSAEWYLAETGSDGPWRVDVVAIGGRRLRHLANVTAALL